MVSAYDALFARLSEEGGADLILVGDSMANVILGLDSTVPVTVSVPLEVSADATDANANIATATETPNIFFIFLLLNRFFYGFGR